MMELVRRYADWWNIPAHHIDRLAELAPAAGSARVSIQQMIGFVRKGSDPEKVREVSARRFGNLGSGLVCGDADELSGHFSRICPVKALSGSMSGSLISPHRSRCTNSAKR